MPVTDADPITSEDQLVAYFHAGSKPASAWRVGVEQEKMPVRDDGSAAPYDGPRGIEALLERLAARGSYQRVEEHGRLIALQRSNESVTLEPGGQLELSGPALPTVLECRDDLRRHVTEVREEGRSLGIRFVAGGFRPFGTLDEVPWLPKRRYDVMRRYLPRKGRLGTSMMKGTATVQANLDYASEANAVDKMRTAFGVTSIVTALFAASPISMGRPNGHKSYRAAIWLDTDEQRCGVLPFVFEPGFGFAAYARWAMDVPMFFVVRDGTYHEVDEFPFRRFMAEGWNGHRATSKDWEVHLSTLFPEVRLKRYIEVRGADAGPLSFAEGLGALWRGLLDDADACQAAWQLVAGWPLSERQRARQEVSRAGLDLQIGGRRFSELALELCKISRAGLLRLPGGAGDAPLLDPLEDAAARGRCPADDMLDDLTAANGDPHKLVDRWELG